MEETDPQSSLGILRRERLSLLSLLIFIGSTILFWILLKWNLELSDLPSQYGLSNTQFVVQLMKSLGKGIFYVNMILWLNSAFHLRELALGSDVKTREYQKRQVIFTLWIFTILIVIELPTWIFVLLSS